MSLQLFPLRAFQHTPPAIVFGGGGVQSSRGLSRLASICVPRAVCSPSTSCPPEAPELALDKCVKLMRRRTLKVTMSIPSDSDFDLHKALNIHPGSSPEALASALSSGILSASSENRPPLTLEAVSRALEDGNVVHNLDVLNIFNPLMRSTDPAAQHILTLLGEKGNAKEVVISIQEAVEQLETGLTEESDFDEQLSPGAQLNTLIKLYSSVLPRMALRKKTPEETIRPLTTQLRSTLNLCSEQLLDKEGNDLVGSTFHMIEDLHAWSSTCPGPSCSELLKTLADSVIMGYHRCFRADVAQRAFGLAFPRLVLPGSRLKEEDPLIPLILDVYSSLGVSATTLPDQPDMRFLILLAHQLPSSVHPHLLLDKLMPLFITSIQKNIALDESLAVLISSLSQISSQPNHPHIASEVTVMLTTLLSPLASSHPDPPTRHLIFKIISLLLSLTQSPQLRLEVLSDLLSNESAPQMRIAAVGLVREAVFQGLASPPNLFASSTLLRTLGGTLFQPDPPDVLSTIDTSQIDESPEPSRLSQCLSFYYALLMRDQSNLVSFSVLCRLTHALNQLQTGVRDQGMIESIEKSLLTPVREFTRRCMAGMDPEEALHQIGSVVSLQIGLERVDAAISSLQ